MKLTDSEIDQVQEWGAYHAPREAGGAILSRKRKRKLVCLENIAIERNAVRHRPIDIKACEADGWILQGYWHTHVRQSVEPSQADLVGCKASSLPWVIVGYPNRRQTLINPSQCLDMPLIGREFCHGSVDCYTLIRDYYQTLGIELPNFYRADNWWNLGGNTYLDSLATLPEFEAIPFREASQVQQHDILLMRINAPVPNHGAIYIGASKMLHHFMNRLSDRTFFSQFYAKKTVMIARHERFKAE